MIHSHNPALSCLFKAKRRQAKQQSICSSFALYERRKADWIRQNRDASSTEYDAAMQRIARECGV